MGINFRVAMVLEAHNRMEGGIRGAMNSIGRLRRSFTDTARETARLNPVSGWSERIAAATRSMEEFGRRAHSIRNNAENSMMNGMKEMATSMAIAMPVIGPIKQAADVQTNWTTMRTMGISADELAEIKENTLRLSQGLTFDYAQVQGVALAINKAGVNGNKLLKMQETATQYSQLEYYRYGSDPNQTAMHLAHIAESSGVFRVDKYEKEKYGLKTQDDIDKFVVKKFNNLTEDLNRVVSVTSSDTSRIAESVKYSMPEAKSLGWSEASALLMTGIYSRFGIEGSMSGTHLKDFASRLNPYQHYIGEDVEKRSNRLTAMQEAGWLEGAEWTTTKTGHKKFSSAGKSVFHNDDGTLKEPEKIFAKIYEAYERFEKEGKRLQFHGILQDVLGEQGKDIANLLTQNPEIFKHIAEDMEKPMSMQEALTERANDTNAQWDIFSGNIKTAGKMMGDLVLGDITNELKWINGQLFNSEEGKKSPVFQWIEDNKELIKWTMKAVLVFAGFTAGIGALKIASAIINFGLISPLATLCGWIGKTGIKLSGLRDAFQYFRGRGGGIFESIGKGAQFAYPWLAKLVGWVARITPLWLTTMGVIGWSIAGVTAVIAGAVLAWNTNFLGFRDTATEAWSWIRDYAEYVCPGISEVFKTMANSVTNEWTYIKNEGNKALGELANTTKWACSAMGIDFEGVTEKVGKFIQKLWDSHAVVMAYNAVSEHFQGFKQWRDRRAEFEQNLEQRDLMAQPEYIIPNRDGTVGDFNQTNNITVPDTDLAAEFVRKSTPQKYTLANPEFNF